MNCANCWHVLSHLKSELSYQVCVLLMAYLTAIAVAVLQLSLVVSARLLAPFSLPPPTCFSCSTCATEELSDICNCDPECAMFGDCCNSPVPPASCPVLQHTLLEEGVSLECVSPFVNPAVGLRDTTGPVLMVSGCPASFTTNEGFSVHGLVNVSTCSDPSPGLPPVTDLNTGVVYRNEHCALCNGATSFVAWSVNLVCTTDFYVSFNSGRYLEEILEQNPNFFSTECEVCSYLRPQLPAGIRQPRECTPNIGTCLSHTELERKLLKQITVSQYSEIRTRCETGSLNFVSTLDTVYRNPACALCNAAFSTACFIGTDRLHETPPMPLCVPLDLESPTGNSKSVPVVVFPLVFTGLSNDAVTLSVMSQSTLISVDCPEGEVPVGLECRPTQCPEGYLETGGTCGGVAGTNQSTSPTTIDCPTALLALNMSEFEDRGNGTIFFEGEVLQVNFYDNSGRPLVCPDNVTLVTVNTTVISLLPGIAELSYVGCSLSVLGTILIFLTYGLFAELRTLPSLLLMNLALAILISSFLFVIGGPIVQQFPRVDLCVSTAILLHFFFLAQFVWMSLFSIEMAHSFHQAKKMVAVSNKKKGRVLLAYLLIGWGLPLAICIVTIGLNFSGHGLVLYGVTSDGRVGICWINHFVSLVVSFVLPLCISQSINLLLLVLVTVFLCHSVRNKSTQHKTDYLRLMRVWLAAFSTTGLTWIFGFLALVDPTQLLVVPLHHLQQHSGVLHLPGFPLHQEGLQALPWSTETGKEFASGFKKVQGHQRNVTTGCTIFCSSWWKTTC